MRHSPAFPGAARDAAFAARAGARGSASIWIVVAGPDEPTPRSRVGGELVAPPRNAQPSRNNASRVCPPPARLRAPPWSRRLPLKGGVILEACTRLLARFPGKVQTMFPVYCVDEGSLGARASRPHNAWHSLGHLCQPDRPTAPPGLSCLTAAVPPEMAAPARSR